jgi:hypothetical protein
MHKINNKRLTYIFTIIVVVILIVSLYIFTKQYSDNCDNSNNISNDINKARILIRQSARYAHAARQDEDQLIALLHANYGSGYLFAAKDIFPETVLVKLFSSYDEYKDFEQGVIKIQDTVNTRTVDNCPNIVSTKDIITKMGGEGDI